MTQMKQLLLLGLGAGFLFAAAGCVAATDTGEGPPSVAVARSASLERSIVLLQMQAQAQDPSTRANCIEAFQSLQDPRVASVIEQGLHDTQPVVRFAAAMVSGKRQELKFKPVLEKMAASDDSDSVRVAATYALRRLGDATNMNFLAQTLVSPDASTRANTAFVLGLLGDPTAVPLLLSRRSETDSRVKFEISAALARLGDPAARRVITSLALSKYAEDQWNALVVCGDLPAEVAGNPLLIGLKEPLAIQDGTREQSVRRQLLAARSLGKQGSTQGGKMCVTYLKDPAPSLRGLAALALGEMLYPSEERVLEPLLKDPDEGVQRAAAAAIVQVWARNEAKVGRK